MVDEDYEGSVIKDFINSALEESIGFYKEQMNSNTTYSSFEILRMLNSIHKSMKMEGM